MKGTALTFRPGCPTALVEEWTTEIPGKWLRKIIGGDLELVPGFFAIEHAGVIQRCVAFCNEHGKHKGMSFNRAATEHWEQALATGLHDPLTGLRVDVLVGPVIVLFGDAEFMEAL